MFNKEFDIFELEKRLVAAEGLLREVADIRDCDIEILDNYGEGRWRGGLFEKNEIKRFRKEAKAFLTPDTPATEPLPVSKSQRLAIQKKENRIIKKLMRLRKALLNPSPPREPERQPVLAPQKEEGKLSEKLDEDLLGEVADALEKVKNKLPNWRESIIPDNQPDHQPEKG